MKEVKPKSNTEEADTAEQHFREFADTMPHILWSARPDGVLDYANKAYLEYFGLSPETVGETWPSIVHPDDMDRIKAVWGASIATGSDYSTEFRTFHKPSGQYRWQAVSAKPIRNESGEIVKWYGSATDIHESKTSAERAELLARRLDATLESLTDGFVMLDHDWRVIYINTAAEKLTQRSRLELIGKVWWDEFPQGAGSQVYQECHRVVREGKPAEFEYYCPLIQCWMEVGIYLSEEGVSLYFRDISKRKQAEEEIQRLAFHDQVTGLPNRKSLHDRMGQSLAASRHNGQVGAFLFIDLDNFKSVNDAHGHEKGDLLLQKIARRLQSCVRPGDTVARFESDEFVVLLEDLHSRNMEAVSQARMVCENMLNVLSQPYKLDNVEYLITPSMGVTLFDGATANINSLYKQADMALYRAKHEGHKISFYDPAMQSAANARKLLETDLKKAIASNALAVHYQPQVDRDGRIAGVEALARWQHPTHGLIPPSIFIPLAEESGLILPLGRWMLQAACAQLAVWTKNPVTAHLTLSVNVSARQFRHPNFVAEVLEIIQQARIDATKLKLELTESILVDDVDEATTKMKVLKAQGIGFSLDDFGTGYSSLSYLRRMPLEQLKIDRSFIMDVPGNINDVSIVEAIIALGRKLGLAIIAEGVETPQQLNFLSGIGCNIYQGYLFSKPLDTQNLSSYIANKV